MTQQKTFLYTGAALLVIVGAIVYHRGQRNAELDRQRAVKTQALVPVDLVTVENRPFRGAIAFTGTLLAVNRAELKAEVSGRITRVSVQEGDRVAAGSVLCAQDEDELLLGVKAAEAQLAQAQAQAAQAKADNDRAQMLLAKHSVTKQSAQMAQTNFDATSAGAQAAESNLGLARTRLRKARTLAPFEGEVAQRSVQPGENLNPGQTSFVVVDNRKLEIQADLPTQALAQVRVGMKARFRVAGFPEPFPATLTQVSPSVQQDGRTVRVRLEVANPGGRLKGGLFAEGEILLDGETQRPALPAATLVTEVREADLFVAEQGIAHRKRVTVGAEQDGWRPVEGLALGTQVVDNGRDHVLEGSPLMVKGAPAAQAKGN